MTADAVAFAGMTRHSSDRCGTPANVRSIVRNFSLSRRPLLYTGPKSPHTLQTFYRNIARRFSFKATYKSSHRLRTPLNHRPIESRYGVCGGLLKVGRFPWLLILKVLTQTPLVNPRAGHDQASSFPLLKTNKIKFYNSSSITTITIAFSKYIHYLPALLPPNACLYRFHSTQVNLIYIIYSVWGPILNYCC